MLETAVVTPVATTPIRVKKLGHLVYEVSDIERSTRFWTEILGFHVSDHNELGMVFLRYGTDHHSIALVPKPKLELPKPNTVLGMSHLAMEVADVDALLKAREYLKQHGVKITFEGRKGPGGNVGVEFEDPDGHIFELYADMDQVGSDGKSRPPEHWHRVKSVEDAVEHPLPANW